ncbi:MAG: decarboxylating 6-phosphogluconate dehydrogenase [Candidatus Babeliaceae bacterium]
MNIGIVGLGKMGAALVSRWLAAQYKVIGYDVIIKSTTPITVNSGATDFMIVDTLEALAQQARIIWLMIPAGKPVDQAIVDLIPFLKPRDIIIDGGNSYFEDSVRHYTLLKQHGISFLDCGVSGGIHGYEQGFSLMIGGDKDAFEYVEPLFKVLAFPQGYAYVGPAGAGHYVKMVHNGIEYALLQAYAEGFQLLKEGHYPHLDLAQISAAWNHGAVIRSWILSLLHEILLKDQDLKNIAGIVDESGMGRWTVEQAHKYKVPVTLIEDALKIREQSHITGGNYATKLVALLRAAFGGHSVHKNT